MPGVIDRPLFVVGMPRSGSTALHRVLARHPDFATTTNLTRKAPTCYPALKLLSCFAKKHAPGEAGSMWDKFVGGNNDIMSAADVTPVNRRYYMRAVMNVLRLYKRPRFLSKCPRNGLRMGFLAEIFPGALFLHLVRDGRAVCQSVMEQRRKSGDIARWWDVKPAGWRQWSTLPPVEAVAHQWDEVVRWMDAAGESMPKDRYLEIRYEDLVADPVNVLRHVMDFAGMSWSTGDIKAASAELEVRPDKWAGAFSPDELQAMLSIMGETMRRHGYSAGP